jgi:DNA-binding MarR family transcriptional regulator
METFADLRRQLDRIVNLYGRLVNRPLDFGLGEPLQPAEMHLLEAVGEGQGDTVTKIAGYLGITKGAVSQTANKLDVKGYLTKERSQEYRKEIILSLSRKGTAALKAHALAHASMEAGLRQRLTGIQEKDFLVFGRMLALLEDHLGELTELAEKGATFR